MAPVISVFFISTGDYKCDLNSEGRLVESIEPLEVEKSARIISFNGIDLTKDHKFSTTNFPPQIGKECNLVYQQKSLLSRKSNVSYISLLKNKI